MLVGLPTEIKVAERRVGLTPTAVRELTEHGHEVLVQRAASMPLARRGTLWTWTSQEFRPITPPYTGPGDASDFEPYFVGYVELPGEVRVEARLSGFDGRTPTIGEEVELVILPFNETIEGDQVVSYAFTPVAEGAST
jgi:hypothetical protein